MSLVNLKRKFISAYTNSRGYRTNRKIVVIESDDWGSIRMASKEVYKKLLAKGYPVDKLSYLKYDSLESNLDLVKLFEVLTSFRDSHGNHPVITANTIISNPDFEKIRTSDFKEYHSELFTETLKKYPEHDKVFELHKQGIANKVFYPQLHGMEHVNVVRWMKALQANNKNARVAFDNFLFDLSEHHTVISEDSFVDALHPNSIEDIDFHRNRLLLAAKYFKELYGYESKSFIAPCYIWNKQHENIFNEIGVELIQCGTFQLYPIVGKVSHFKKKLHFTGELNRLKQKYSVRNCIFEPSVIQRDTVVEDTINQIERAFKNKKPAIISSHRVNYIGFIDAENREKTLNYLFDILNKILIKWPDVEFMTSEDINTLLR